MVVFLWLLGCYTGRSEYKKCTFFQPRSLFFPGYKVPVICQINVVLSWSCHVTQQVPHSRSPVVDLILKMDTQASSGLIHTYKTKMLNAWGGMYRVPTVKLCGQK